MNGQPSRRPRIAAAVIAANGDGYCRRGNLDHLPSTRPYSVHIGTHTYQSGKKSVDISLRR